MAIDKMDLIKNPETAPFSKLKYLRRLPEDEVTEFFSPHAEGKSVMFLVAVGRPGRRSGRALDLQHTFLRK